MLTPTDFDPYRAEIAGCWCRPCATTGSDGGRALHAALVAGTHRRMTQAERAAEARAAKAVRLAEAQARGATPAELAAIERGYVAVKMSDFYATGMGLGIGPR